VSDYPEHDRLRVVAEETQTAGEFVEWLGGQGYFLAEWPVGWDRAVPCHHSLTELLARWKGIDRDKVEEEKRAMLARLREKREGT
jgi:hypothetical protein